jgi:hypothetical protein
MKTLGKNSFYDSVKRAQEKAAAAKPKAAPKKAKAAPKKAASKGLFGTKKAAPKK